MQGQSPPKSISSREFERQIHGLVTDPGFLRLQQERFRLNLFEIVAASHRELWHSAFLKWLLDPQSYHGLGDFPLKRFLFAVCSEGILPETEERPDLSLGIIETLDLTTSKFVNEWSIKGGGRIDLLGTCEDEGIRILIENKIQAKESHDQTNCYWQYMQETSEGWATTFRYFCPRTKPNNPPAPSSLW